MRYLSKQQILGYFDRVAATVDGLSPHMQQARHPARDADSYDYASLLALGVEDLFAPMLAHQPKAHAALMALRPELLACELTTTDPGGQRTWTNDAFFGSGERYFRVGAHFRNDSIAAIGERSVYWSRYASLPPGIAEAYYRIAAGFEVVHELPSNPYQSRVLPAHIGVWLRADQVGGSGKKQTAAIMSGLSAVADPDVTPGKDGLVWKSFSCVLDSREQDAVGPAGDLLFVQDRSASQRVFHVHDGDFAAVRQVDDPIRLYDEYVAWVFADGSGRFDFSAHSRPA